MGCGSSVPAKGPGPAPRPAKGTDGSGTPEGKATNGIGGDGTIVATVAEVRQETSAVKLLRLRVPTKSVEGGEFAFRPGQWVDFYAPGVDKPGGYSIASSPGQLARDGGELPLHHVERNRVDPAHPLCVLCGDCHDDARPEHAELVERLEVGLDAGPASRVGARDGEG